MCYGYEGWFKQRRAVKPERTQTSAPERKVPEPSVPSAEHAKPAPEKPKQPEREPA